MESNIMITSLALWMQATQTHLDSMLLRADASPGESGKQDQTLLWVLGIGGAVLLCLCVVPVLIICVLTLLGPAIGNVFSNIVNDI
jgi:ABC-type Fe3+ transport system permease subunit